MDNALDSDSKDCRFDPGRAGQPARRASNTLSNLQEHIFMLDFPKIFLVTITQGL